MAQETYILPSALCKALHICAKSRASFPAGFGYWTPRRGLLVPSSKAASSGSDDKLLRLLPGEVGHSLLSFCAYFFPCCLLAILLHGSLVCRGLQSLSTIMLVQVLTLLGAGAGAVLAQDSSASVVAPTVTLEVATLFGTQTGLPSATQAVNKYLGVPFAESPPVRFAPPQPKTKLNGPLTVTEWKHSCIQQFAGSCLLLFHVSPFGLSGLLERKQLTACSRAGPLPQQLYTIGVFNQPPPEESEDCLYLNVYAPATAPPDGGRAVMFWLYGGKYRSCNY